MSVDGRRGPAETSPESFNSSSNPLNASDLAESIRQATLQAAISAYEDAGMQGLCEEGRWEAAVSAMRALDLSRLMRIAKTAPGSRLRDDQGPPGT